MASSPLSVLMAVYAGDRADWLADALSSLALQTRPAEEIIVVEDGPLPVQLSGVLDEMTTRLPIQRIALTVNGGLSAALQAGLEQCRFELIARMDSDDIAEPQRFERQLAVLSTRRSLSVLGGYVAEFTDDPASPYAIRKVPTGEQKVAKVARWRSPVNHPAVMFRRADVMAVGGYSGFTGIEDYYLWGKLLAAGRHIDNLPEILVRQRAGLPSADDVAAWTTPEPSSPSSARSSRSAF